jgi:hypothetical protein
MASTPASVHKSACVIHGLAFWIGMRKSMAWKRPVERILLSFEKG